MKNKIYFLTSLILFQSCYSYKTIDFSKDEILNTEKVKIQFINKKKLKGTISKIKNDSIYLEGIAKTSKISKSDVKTIKKKEFSWSKTVMLSSAYLMSLLLAFLVYFSKNAFK